MKNLLAAIGIVAILCAGLGLWINLYGINIFLFGKLEPDPETPYFVPVFCTMTAICTICFLFLIGCAVQLIRGKTSWVPAFVRVLIIESAYFFSIGFFWLTVTLIFTPEFGHSVAAATGVANTGLMVQFIIFFPLWGSLLALYARRKIEAASQQNEAG